MKKQIVRISPLQTAKVLAVIYFAISLLFLLVIVVIMLFVPGPRQSFLSGYMLAIPFVYAIIGFVLTLMGAWVYNLIAKYLGGVEFSTRQELDD